jgi:hypothetical protein
LWSTVRGLRSLSLAFYNLATIRVFIGDFDLDPSQRLPAGLVLTGGMLDFPPQIAADHLAILATDIAGVDSEGLQHPGQVLIGEGAAFVPDAPGAVVQVLEPTEQEAGGEIASVAGLMEGVLQVVQQLHGVVLPGPEALLEDGEQGLRSLMGPRAADGLGDVEQRFDQVLLAMRQGGREAMGEAEGFGGEPREVLLGPLLDPGLQVFCFLPGLTGEETLDGIFGMKGFEKDGDGALGEALGQRGRFRQRL